MIENDLNGAKRLNGLNVLNKLPLLEPWLPDNFDYLALADPERRVYNALYFHQGGAAAVKIEDLAMEAFPFRPASSRERNTRDILKYLTERKKVAIGSSCRKPYGIYLITDPDELLAYTQNLTARAMSMLTRAASLRKVSLPVYLGQLRADFEAEQCE
jgi:hypothetical protein